MSRYTLIGDSNASLQMIGGYKNLWREEDSCKPLKLQTNGEEPGSSGSGGGGFRGRGGRSALGLEVGGVETPDGRWLGEALVHGGAVPVLVVRVVLLGPRLVVVRGRLLLGVGRALNRQQGRAVVARSGA
jgi:hypothetical protein